jgi:hypothetical protein
VTARRGEVDGTAVAFAWVWAHGGVQKLGAYVSEAGEATTFQRSGLFTFDRPRSATQPWRCSGWRSRQRKETRGSRLAASKATLLDGGGIT